MPDDAPLPPEFRVTVTRRGVMLLPWSPWLAGGRPVRVRRGVTVADVRVVRDEDDLAREVIVEVLAGDDPEARQALERWAVSVGYERIWFPDDVVEIESHGLVGGLARARGRTCGTTYAERRPEFWLNVRRDGGFPWTCPTCNGDLAQWAVAEPAWRPSTADPARG